ncbi:MAG: hypothetical protein LUE27_08285 [Clostridia bacterium]|nr:hypothetical protein [Clostridia bacterium]
MNITLFYNTPENHEAAKRLLKKYAARTGSYPEDEADYFASAVICVLCDRMSGIGWYDMEMRLDGYINNPSAETWLPLVSGMEYAKLVYLSEKSGAKGKPGRPVFVNLIEPGEEDMKEKHLPVMPLYSSKRHSRNPLVPDTSMHQTNLKAVMKMCRNAGVDYVYLDPTYNKSRVFSIEGIEHTLENLDSSLEFILRQKGEGFNGEDFFDFLLMTFSENYVKCKFNGKIVTGVLFIDRESNEMAVSIYNYNTDKEYNMPVSAIKWIKEIDRGEV